MRSLRAAVARVALLGVVASCGAISPSAASQQTATVHPDVSSNAVSAGSDAASGSQESTGGGVLRRLIAHEFRVSTVLWPGSVGEGVDPFWAEIEYRPRVTATRSRVSGTAELLFRATMSGFAHSPDGSSPDPGRRSLRVQSDRQAALVKELSLSVDTPVDLVIGWQILGWGHATDGVRVLDVFQRQDLTDRLRPEQLGIAAVSASFGNGDWAAEAVWVPSGSSDRIPAATSNIWYAFPRSSTVGRLDETAASGFSLSNGEGGVRISRYGQRGDFAVMVARTRDRAPSLLEFRPDATAGALQARPLFEPYWLVGASAVRTAGSYLLRAEALRATYPERLGTLVKHGIRGVAGVERRVTGSGDSRYTFIAQYATDTTGSAEILQEGTYLASPFRIYRHALTGSAAAAWRQQYELEMRLMRELNRGSMVASAKFSYRHGDHLTMWVAADYVAGRHGTWLERLDAADRILAGINVSP
jgi:hypothetical protein